MANAAARPQQVKEWNITPILRVQAWVDNTFQSMGLPTKTGTGSKYQDDTQHVVMIPDLAFNGYNIFFLIRYMYIR